MDALEQAEDHVVEAIRLIEGADHGVALYLLRMALGELRDLQEQASRGWPPIELPR